MKRIDNYLENVSGVVMSCIILHNICQRRKDDGQVLDEVIRQERDGRQGIQANNNFCIYGDALFVTVLACLGPVCHPKLQSKHQVYHCLILPCH